MDEDDQPSSMMEQAVTGLGLPRETFHWPFPKKPLGKPTGKSAPGAKGAPKSVARSKGPRKSKGVKQKKTGIYAGWD